MASLCGRLIACNINRSLFITSVRCWSTKVTLGDPVEQATGLEKREILAHLAGNEDPFDMNVMKRGPGTKEQPNEIPSAYDARIVGCICEEDAQSVNWMWLHKGKPRRCYCGHWFKLVYKPPV